MIIKHLDGDPDAFTELFKRYYGKVLGKVRKKVGGEIAEDIVQEVFLKVKKSLPKFRFESKFTTWLFKRVVPSVISDYLKKHTKKDKSGRSREITVRVSRDSGATGHSGNEDWFVNLPDTPEDILSRIACQRQDVKQKTLSGSKRTILNDNMGEIISAEMRRRRTEWVCQRIAPLPPQQKNIMLLRYYSGYVNRHGRPAEAPWKIVGAELGITAGGASSQHKVILDKLKREAERIPYLWYYDITDF